jgi:hypothetical protein
MSVGQCSWCWCDDAPHILDSTETNVTWCSVCGAACHPTKPCPLGGPSIVGEASRYTPRPAPTAPASGTYTTGDFYAGIAG